MNDLRRVVRKIAKRLEAGEVLTYKDVKSKKLEAAQDKWVVSYLVYMELVREGVVCHVGQSVGQTGGNWRRIATPPAPVFKDMTTSDRGAIGLITQRSEVQILPPQPT